MIHRLIYYWHALLSPELKDFVDMGLGIEARYKRCKQFWDPHLSKSRDFVSAGLGSCYGRGVAILGAGRLFDVDTQFLSSKFSRILCVDADPSAKRVALSKFQPGVQVEFIISEITGTISHWARSLKKFLRKRSKNRTVSKVQEFLESLEVQAPPFLLQDFEAIVSLNLLGQIPLYWRDRSHLLVEKYLHIPIEEDGELPEPLRGAIRNSMEKLQRAHLAALAKSGAARVVLIYDTHFRYYADDGEVLSEAGAKVDPREVLAGYTLEHEESWIWDIAPQGIEFKEYGVRHSIVGQVFAKTDL